MQRLDICLGTRLRRARSAVGVQLRLVLGVVLTAAGLMVAVSPVASAEATYLYWTDQISGNIERIQLDGTNQETWLSGRNDPSALATDGTYLYWSEYDNEDDAGNAIFRAPIADASAATKIASTRGISYGIAVNETHLYWSEYGTPDGGVWRADPDGTGATEIIPSGVANPAGLAINSTHLFVAARGDGKVIRTDFDGGSQVDLISTAPNSPDGVSIDSSTIYFTQSNARQIGRANIDGTDADEDFMTQTGQVNEITTFDNKIYWASYASEAGIYQSNLDGSGLSRLVAAGIGPIGVVVIPGSGSATSPTAAAFADFTYLLPDGRECSSISPQRVQVGTMVELPGETALCQTSDGSLVAGWVVPVKNGFTGYGSASEPFPPGLPVRVVGSQRFTLVPFEPVVTIEYDANIADDDVCTPANLAHASENGRIGYS